MHAPNFSLNTTCHQVLGRQYLATHVKKSPKNSYIFLKVKKTPRRKSFVSCLRIRDFDGPIDALPSEALVPGRIPEYIMPIQCLIIFRTDQRGKRNGFFSLSLKFFPLFAHCVWITVLRLPGLIFHSAFCQLFAPRRITKLRPEIWIMA